MALRAVRRCLDHGADHLAGREPVRDREREEGRLPPGRPAWLGHDRAITLTSWASDAEVTRSLCLRSVISRLPTTTASATVSTSSSRRGA